MPKSLRALALAALLSASLPFSALAQDTTTDPAPAAAADPTLAMGTPSNAAPALKSQEEAAVGDVYLAASFDAWEQRCVKTEDGSDPCRLYQLLKTADGNPTAEFVIFSLPAGGQAAAGGTVLVPLETLLSANLAVGFDANQPMIYPYTVCDRSGCLARIGFSAEQLAQMKNGAKGTLTIVPAGAPDQTVPLEISLKGFTAGYEAVAATLQK